MATKLETKVYTQEGKDAGVVSLPVEVFGVKWNPDLVHEVVTGMLSNARTNTAHTKDRGEVRGGGKKPWRQKGTGRARHGSRRSPIWRGGGVTFGPRNERNYTKKINKKVRAKALTSVLSRKLSEDSVIFVDELTFTDPKAAEARTVLTALGKVAGADTITSKRQNALLMVLPSRDVNTEKSFQNFGNVLVMQAKDISPVALLTYKYVVFTQPTETLEILTNRVMSKSPSKKEVVKVEKKTKVKTPKQTASVTK